MTNKKTEKKRRHLKVKTKEEKYKEYSLRTWNEEERLIKDWLMFTNTGNKKSNEIFDSFYLPPRDHNGRISGIKIVADRAKQNASKRSKKTTPVPDSKNPEISG